MYEFNVISSRAIKAGDQLALYIKEEPAYAEVVPFHPDDEPVPSTAAATIVGRFARRRSPISPAYSPAERYVECTCTSVQHDTFVTNTSSHHEGEHEEEEGREAEDEEKQERREMEEHEEEEEGRETEDEEKQEAVEEDEQ